MALPAFTRSLSARLLVLTVFFVMLSEVLIYTPSIARFRQTWLEEKLSAGHLAALTIVAAPEGMVTAELEAELLDHVGAHMVDLTRRAERTYMLGHAPAPPPDIAVDLGDRNWAHLIVAAYDTLLQGDDRVIALSGRSPLDPDAFVEMLIDERPLRLDMADFSWRILALSIVISLITASLVFLSLRWLLVRPMMRLTATMVAFRENPEDAETIIVPSRRADEVGVAERELHAMQTAVRRALKQQERLAALGTAVTKISHDLRNILSTASLLSERLAESDDPEARRTTPRLMEAIDRAVDLCRRTLSYTSEDPPLQRSNIRLRELVEAVREDLTPESRRAGWVNLVPEHLTVQADRAQLRRVFDNLAMNAFEAGAEHVTVTAERTAAGIEITIADDGPGLPPRAREHLFQPFAGSARPGGTGLGLAIARDIVAAHRGVIRLVETGADGTVFRILLPI